MEGIVLIDKPSGITSHDVVDRVRRRFKMKQVGHAGTLDPLATGLLIILIGKATKFFDRFSGFDKAYRATLILGTTTDSGDTQGKITRQSGFENITREQADIIFNQFKGESKQLPPMYSAVKVKGKKLYELARQGIKIDREPRDIRVDQLRIEEFTPPNIRFYLECSKGTYVRQLAEDIGEKLGCGACISQIQRVGIGKFHINQAVSLENLNESHLQPCRI